MDDGPWYKTYSSRRGQWTFHSHHEKRHSKAPAHYELDAGFHTFSISGRSKGFSIDRIHLFKEGLKGEDASLPESSNGIPELPDSPALARVNAACLAGRLGTALKYAEKLAESDKGDEAEAGKQAVEALNSYPEKRRRTFGDLKSSDPLAALAMLADLAGRYKNSNLGRELAGEVKQWSQEPAVRDARAAEGIYSMVNAAAGCIHGSGNTSDPDFARRYGRELQAIAQGTALLKAKYPGTAAFRKALAIAQRFGIDMP
jgi:hypothetical protein